MKFANFDEVKIYFKEVASKLNHFERLKKSHFAWAFVTTNVCFAHEINFMSKLQAS